MAKLLIDFIEAVDKISHKIIKGTNGYYLPKITSDHLNFEIQHRGITGETSPDSTLNIAIKRSQSHLLGEQDKEEGFWAGVLEGDVALTAEYLMLMHFLKRIDKKKQEKAIRYITKKQENDGGWSIYHDGDSDVSISVKCYFALKLAGHSEQEPVMQKARECILNLGGIMKCNTFTKIYLAIFGQFDWRGIPALPVEIILLPNFFYFNIYEMSYWSRCIVVPLSIIMTYRSKFQVGIRAALDELYVIPKERVSYRLKRDQNKLTIKNYFINFDTILRRYENQPISSLRKIAIEKSEKWMLERFEKSGGLGGIWPSMVNSLMAMKCLGYEDGNPAVEKAIEDIEALAVYDEDTMFLQPCVSPVWDTPWAIMALLKSGLSNNHPALVKAGEWMLEKEVKSFGDWSVKNPVKEPSGWYFQHANEFYPDNDDAAVVMMSLQLLDLPDKDRKKQAILRGFKWLMGMQCNDGGWGSFDKNNNKKILNNIPFADWNALLDPSTSDLAARVLDLMGRLGYDLSFPPAEKALSFLRKEQEKNGSWFGRWGTNYVYGTWSVLTGLHSIKEDMTKDYIRKATSWLKDFQNEDGGWGETCKSYWDTSLSATGKSTPSQTSWAVLGLLCTEERDSDSVRNGIEYLIKTQKEDGTWDEKEFTGTGFPKVFYLRYHMYRSYFPLLALSKYRNLVE